MPATHAPRIALTFDDGPGDHTLRLLQILDDVGGHATFFAVGERLDEYAEQARAVLRQGSDLWGHGWDHASLVGMPGPDVFEQLTRTRDRIGQVTGITPPAFRPPNGHVDQAVQAQAARAGQAVILWSLGSGDWQHKDRDQTIAAVLGQARDGAIVLCHEWVDSTPDAMAQVMPELVARGFRLVTAAELLSSAALEPGRIYESA